MLGTTDGLLEGAVVGIRGASVGMSVGTPSARTEEDRWVGAAVDILSSILGIVSMVLTVPPELLM
jgi:hypothetical protein